MVLVKEGIPKLIVQRESYKDITKNNLRLDEYEVFTLQY